MHDVPRTQSSVTPKEPLIALFALAASVNAFAADTDSHQVTVEVMPINELALDGGDVYLLINTATAGEDPDPATDASASLRWTTNESNKKIVVATDNAAPKFRLFVEAGSVSGGAGAGQVELSTAPQDFVSGISLTVGAAQLQYEARALAADGTGTDVHNVTYTLVDA